MLQHFDLYDSDWSDDFATHEIDTRRQEQPPSLKAQFLTIMIPALEGKLNTNYVPTPKEIIDIKDGLAGSEERLRALSLQIDHLRDRCTHLSVEKERLSVGITKYRGMLAPARRLIPEILQEIFYHCLPTSHNAIMSSKGAPLLLGRVCSQWRQVAYSTPRLWATIHIVVPSAEPYNPNAPTDNSSTLSVVSSWLSRSGALPLSISLSSSVYSLDPSIPTNPVVRPFLDLLTPFASRWKSIAFKIENYDWTEFFGLYSANDVPLLEKAHFDGIQVPRPASGESHPPDFVAAIRDNGILHSPRLRSVSIPRYGAKILQLPIRWSELIELNLSNGAFSLQDILKALAQCPSLLNCSVSVSDWNSVVVFDELYTPPKVVLPKLEVLMLKDDMGGHDMPALLESLIAPQLQHLAFRRGMNWGGELYSDLRPLMRAFGVFFHSLIQPLQELWLEANSLPGDAVMQLLEMLPGLKRLSIESFGKAETAPDEQTPFVWTTPNSFYFTDAQLRRFIPKVLTIRVQLTPSPAPTGSDANDTDSDLVSDSDAPPDETSQGLLTSPSTSSRSESKTIIGRLCPSLEVFCCSGAMFSESLFLEFLRARSIRHHELGVAHLRRASVSFVPGRKKSEDFARRVLELGKQTGMGVHLNYMKPLTLPPLHRDSLFSPYQGIDTAEDLNYPPVHFGFW